jgi:hypothetical protein
MNLTFVETQVFTARWHKRSNDDSLSALQKMLLGNCRAGDSIPGCGILRKLRLPDPSRRKGKRGGLRVIYLYTPEASRVDLITVYSKEERDDLSKSELAELCELARNLRMQLLANVLKSDPGSNRS